jgi:muramoyltetrapeptide carboxypeptidase
MIQPPSLHKNDVVGIVAPGRKLDTDTIHASIRIIESWGFNVRAGKNLFSSKHSYLSGSDTERLYDLQSMLDDPSVKAIICARGGYGTTRILDQLDFTSFLKKPKWICGFSDISALHLKLQTLGIQSIHGAMPVTFCKPESVLSVETLRKTLIGERVMLEAHPDIKNKMGETEGLFIGGNLSLLVDSLGTSSEIDTRNKILIIEEVDEYVYRIDRMLMQLKRAKKLQPLAGLVVGHLTDIKESELPFGESVQEVILNQVAEFAYPVGFGFPVGHENPNFSWIEGSAGNLKVTAEKSVISFR